MSTKDFILGCLAAQENGEPIGPAEHQRLIRLVDAGLLGMDGFKYCWPEVAKENYARLVREGVVRIESERKRA